MNETLTITRLGQRGDGIAETPAGQVFVPYALPGETVRAVRDGERAQLVEILAPAESRVAAICPLFTRCGGCAAQHMADAFYRDWKRQQVVTALARAGIEAPVAEIVDAHGAGRRRVTFHARFEGGGMLVGFMAARSHGLIAVETCPVLAPGLERAPAVAQMLANRMASSNKPLDLQITASDAGLDVDIRGHGPAGDKLRLALTQTAERLDLARLAMHGEIIVERRPPLQLMGKAHVAPAPGGFLQATAEGEERIAALVSAAIPKAKRVADLFAGCGPFSFRLAERMQVHAVEGEKAAILSLLRAAGATQGLKPISAEQRDLFRRPLLEHELNGFDAVILDPPRAGAEAQVKRIAASKLATVVYVSCDVGSFARDAALLIAGGYALEGVTPVDQFRYSAHIELVGVFRRGKTRK
ncbi:class I SAM-dependent RNA methyltransferase [Bosea caraganae]|uniref:Class I SAM-dependent RNA methyltransferase n=1 Tax=Bosea caraganae TaxID=2763117 RepID=A0A370KZS9_9HYPH|nr:class I SAM-dependent RNA methyltransferase [Bosea caraganae]RDJ20510.1 class I SAM-dependent RNA methyltransferase [Bosea caraganae]RDJ30026.1 class I SAM-dependent RNA methyltransferase [Bosea caraganae]